MKSKLLSRMIWLGALAALLLSACTAGVAPATAPEADSDTSEPVEVQVWHRWFGEFGSPQMRELLSTFQEEHPEIVIEEKAVPGEYVDLIQQMTAMMAAGEDPPAVFVGGYNLLNYVAEELSPIPFDEEHFGEEVNAVLDQYYPATKNLGVYKGVQVALPFALSNPVMYYNPEIFEAAGLDPDSPPTTWAEVVEQGRIIKEQTGKSAIYIQTIDNWLDQALVFSNGGSFLSEDGQRVEFNGPQEVEVYEMWADLVEEGLHPLMTQQEAVASFTAGDIAMNLTTIGALSSYRTNALFDLGVAPLPTFGDRPIAVPSGGAGIFILPGSPERQAAAWELAKFMTSEEGFNTWVQTGYVAPTQAEVSVAEGQEIAYGQLPNAVPWAWWPAAGPTALEIDRIFLDSRTKIIWGEAGVQETLDKAVADSNALLE